MKKKVAAIVVIAAIVIAAIAGYKLTSNTVFQYGDIKVKLPEATVYAEIQQYSAESQYGSYFGEEMWSMEVEDGVTLEESIKSNTIKQIKAVKVLAAHAEDMKVSLSDEEKKEASDQAETFIKSDEGKKIMEDAKADEELIQNMYEENALATKVHQAIIDKVDTEVTDEEACVKTVYKLVFATKKTDTNGQEVELSDEEKAKQKKKAQKAYKALKKGADISFLAKQYDVKDTANESFGPGQSAGGKEFEAAVSKLKKGEFTSVIEDDEGYVIAKLITDYDKEKTKENKSTVLEERQNQAYQDQYEEWTKDLEKDWDDKKSINTKVWDKVKFQYGTVGSSDTTTEATTEASSSEE
ncbi:MAG: peptidyl-prolyl cis-trans isomerase [Lachnospiraceae bacterium]|nr:peptidyl-prolyl cis-trans isomerase [Lachnospiraceae bacterium]